MPNFSLGLSALRSSQYALEVVSNNLANANTDGHHRRQVHFQELPPNQLGRFRIGSGVNIHYIERIRDQITEASLTNVISDVSHVDQLLVLERQIEATLLNGNSSVGTELDQLFAELTKLTAAPDEPAQRAAVIETGQRLAGVLRQAASQLSELKSSVRFQITQEVGLLNQHMDTLSELNMKIQNLTAQGFQANTELDQRDALLNEIAEMIGISRNDFRTGELNLMIGSASIQQVNISNQFTVTELPDGEIGLVLDNSDRPLKLESGRIVALLEVFNETIPKYAAKLDQLAGELMREFDSIHATGIGTDGSFQHLVGNRVVDNAAIPLAEANAVFPMQAGELTVSVIDSDGLRRSEVISIDPTADSLDDVTARLSAIDGLSAAVNPSTNQLQILAAQGISFDFTGSLETHPRLNSFSGTSLPTFSGLYSGATNQQLTFDVEGSGEVGISDNLFINVYSESGTLVNRINIGNGYEAGTEIDLGDGIQLSLGRGTVAAGDQFTTRLTAEPDQTGFLAALGLNSFFSGVGASSIEIDSDIIKHPGRLAAGWSGDSADTHNLFRLTALEDSSEMPGNLTFSEYVNEINNEIGIQINTDSALSSSLHALQVRIEQERDSYSGVDLNEEMVYLQQFQKSYEAAVRVIQAADDVLNELFTILR